MLSKDLPINSTGEAKKKIRFKAGTNNKGTKVKRI